MTDAVNSTSQSFQITHSMTSLVMQTSINESITINAAVNSSMGRNAITLTPFETRVVPLFYVIICIVGLVGNGTVIAALTTLIRKNRFKSVSDILVINLAVADFIFVGCLPFWASQEYLRKRWLFGMIGCKLLSFNTLLNLYASVFFVVAMGIDRCFAVVFVIESIGRRTPKRAVVACFIIWMTAVAVASQALVFRETVSGIPIQCVWNMPDKYVHVYYGFRVAVGFFIPFAIMLCCYIMIIIKLKRTANNDTISHNAANTQRKVTAAILAVMSLFVVCWLPNHIVTLISAVTYNDAEKRKLYGLETANLVSVCLAYANSALNPILYAFMKADIRKESRNNMIGTFSACFRPIRGFNRARQSISRLRGMKLSALRSTTGTVITTATATARYREAAAKNNFAFPNENLSIDNPSYRSFPINEIVYKREESHPDEHKVNLMVNVANERQ